MNHLNKEKLGFIIVFEILVLLIYGLIFKFNFDNLFSIIIFTFLLVAPFIIILIINLINHIQILKELELKSDNLSIIKKDFQLGKFNKEFIKPLKTLIKPIFGKIEENRVSVLLGSIDQLVIVFEIDKITVAIANTIIHFDMYYDYNNDINNYINMKDYEKLGTSHLYKELIIFVQSLINKEFYYSESYFGKKIVGCIFKDNDKILYEFHTETPLKTLERTIYIK